MERITLRDFNKNRTRKTKRWLGWLSFCMMLFMGQVGFAQTVQIGSGTITTTATANTVPITNYHYSYCQIIVTEAQITADGGSVGEISKLRFYTTAIGTLSVWADNWTIYLGNTTKTDFSSDTDWVALANLQEVYTGAVTPVANNWWEVTFITPFDYTGGNLIIAIDENTPGWIGVPTFRTFTSGTNSAIYYRTDNVADNPDPASPPLVPTGGALGRTAVLPQMQLYFTEACAYPETLTATSITQNSAVLGWTSDGSLFDIEWGTTGFAPTGNPNSANETGITADSFSLNGLTPATSYEFYVRQDCSATNDGLSSWSGPYSFTTACELPDAPTGITFTSVTATGTTINYEAPGIVPTGYIIIRSTSNVPPVLVDGTTYTVSQTTANTSLSEDNDYFVVYNGTALSGSATSLTSNTEYYYYVFSRSSQNSCVGAPWYSLTALSGSQVTAPVAPTAYVLNSFGFDNADISWTASATAGGEAGVINYFVEVYTDSGYTTPVAGSPFSTGTDTTYNLTGLAQGITHFIRIRANNGFADSTFLTGSFATIQPGQVGSGVTTTSTLPILSNWGYNYSQQIYTKTQVETNLEEDQNFITKIKFFYNGTSSTATPGSSPATTNFENWTVYLGNTDKTSFATTTDWVAVDDMQESFSGTVTFPAAGNWMEILLDTPFQWDGLSNIVVAVDENSPDYGTTVYWRSFTSETNTGIYYRNDSTNPDPAFPPTASSRVATLAQIVFDAIETPDCFPVTGLTTTNITPYTVDLSWTATENLFDVAYGTPGFNPDNGGTVVSNITDNPYTLEGLLAETTYQIYVRQHCGGDSSPWTGPIAFTTAIACHAPTTLTHDQLSITSASLSWTSDGTAFELKWGAPGFDIDTEGISVGNIEGNSHTLSGLTTDEFYQFYVRRDCTATTDGYSSWSGPYSFSVGYCTSVPTSNDALGITDVSIGSTSFPVADVTYYNYSDTVIDIVAGIENPSSVTFATGYGYDTNIWIDFNDDGMFDNDTELVFQGESTSTNPTTLNTSFHIPFDASTGQYKLRIGTADSGQATPNPCYSGTYGVTIDAMVTILPPPACLPPSNLSIVAAAISADLGWTSDGALFDIEWGEAGFIPTETPTISEVSNPYTLSGLTPLTDYEFYVRQNCEVGTSLWVGPFSFTTECLPPAITGTTSGEVCGQGEVTLSATADGDTIAWYTSETGGTKLAEGATFTTPLLTETTSYWVETFDGSNGFGARLAPVYTSGAYTTASNYGLVFTATEEFTLNTVDVYLVGTAGNLVVNLTNGSGTVLDTRTITLPAIGTTTTPALYTVTLDFNIEPGNYRLMAASSPNMVRETSPGGFPYAVGDVASITGGYISGASTTYYYFYNWGFTAGCSSARTEVIATVTDAPAFEISAEEASICEGETTDAVTITTGSSDYDTYVWSPATGVTGDAANGWTFNPTETTTYTLTASQSAGVCATSVEVTVTVNDLPIISGITANAIEICEGTSVELNASDVASSYCSVAFSNAIEPITLVEISNINNATSAAIDGTPALEDFTAIVGNLEAGTTYPITLNGNTDGNYINNFYVYIDWNQNGVFTDAGETYSIGSISNNTGSGTPLIGSIAVPATALNGNTRMRVLKKFSASTNPGSCNISGFGQAEDYTVNITGGVDTDTFSWSDGTSVVSTESSLTITPTTTTTYTVTVTNGHGCITTDSVVVTVNPVPGQPVLACYETATFNSTTCQWDVTGDQPEEPILACYETATFNDITCQWDVTGEQPEEPVLACYETATFNDITCQWDVTGEQPEEPILACYEIGATFNTTTCQWDVIGEQPEEPVLACYETATFNDITCQWDVIGEQPEEPVLACYETATFNDITCQWDVTGEQPEEPVLACYETATFNETTCQWDVTGEQPAAPVAESPQSMTVEQTVADIDVVGENLTWYSDSDLTTIVEESFVLTEGTYTFWVTQTIGGCTSTATEIEIEVTLSTDRFDTASFRAYPNPVKDFFTISYSSDITDVMVINMLGQTVISKTVNAADTQIDMSLLPTGTYFVKVNLDGITKTIKVAKQ